MSENSSRTEAIAKHLEEAAKNFQKLRDERRRLLGLIADSFKRQATNRDPDYRERQLLKVGEWLECLTKMFEEHPQLWTAE